MAIAEGGSDDGFLLEGKERVGENSFYDKEGEEGGQAKYTFMKRLSWGSHLVAPWRVKSR